MSASVNKLRFKVVSFSSEDDDHPADQLNTVNPNTKVSILGTELDNYDDQPKSITKLPKKVDYKASSNVNTYNDITYDMNLDPQTAEKLRQLASAKMRAIEEEDYLTAKEIKIVEQDLKIAGSKLAQLDMSKAAAVRDEDYDLAKEIKDQADEMRREIEMKIMGISIPGVTLTSKAHKPQPSRFAPEKNDRFSNSVDDMPVGGSSGHKEGPGSGRKVAKVELHHMPSFDDDMGGAGIASGSPVVNARGYYGIPEEDNDVPLMDRPIRPKNNTYANPQADIDDDPMGYRDAGDASGAAAQYPPGQHPLEGVPKCTDHVVPETFTGKSKDTADSGGVTSLLGEPRARCLFSKTWTVRDALMTKVQLMFRDELQNQPGLAASLPGLCTVIRVGVEDKQQQVLLGAIQLMEDVLQATKTSKLPKPTVAPLFDPVITQLLEKQNDGNARMRDGARKGLDLLAAAPSVGPHIVAQHALRPIPPKQKAAWRPLQARIKLLSDLVRWYGLNNSSGLHHDALLALLKSSGAFAHSNGEVRDAARDLVVSIQKITGTAVLEPVLKELRAKQREEYEAAFEGKSGAADAKAESKPVSGAKSSSSKGSDSSRTDKQLQHTPHSPGGKVHTSATKVANSKDGFAPSHAHSVDQTGGGETQDFTSCMFCGVHNAQWAEADLDVHYWKDCPLLISCPSCAQIVEIAGLPEHQLDECDAKEAYVPCDITGLAIRATEFESWKRSSNCKPAPHNCMYCPLCLSSVEDSDEAWLRHLTDGCPRNTRTNGSS